MTVQLVMSRRLILVAVLLFASIAEARDRAVLVYPRERSIFRRIFYTTHQGKLRDLLRARFDLDVHVQIATDDAIFAIDVDASTARSCSCSPVTAIRSRCISPERKVALSMQRTANGSLHSSIGSILKPPSSCRVATRDVASRIW
jgi:hypothetical protein